MQAINYIFQRKPAHINYGQTNRNRGESRKHQHKKKLGLQTNIINYAIQENIKELKMLESPLFSIEGTPMRSTLDNYIPPDSLNKYYPVMKLQYSPDSICSNSIFCQLNVEESFLLADDPEPYTHENSKKRDYEQTTKSRLSQSCENQNVPACSLFKVNEDNIALKVALLSISSYVFKIDYEPLNFEKIKETYEIEKKQFTEDRLVLKMKTFFKSRPYQLFYFYGSFLKKWNSTALRKFLIEKCINFSGEEIKTLQSTLSKCVNTMKIDEIMDLMFLSKETQDIFILNLEGQINFEAIDTTSNSFWQTFSGFMTANNYFRQKIPLSTPLEIFMSTLF